MFLQHAKPPYVLYLAWHCHRWGALPIAGGVLDQPAGLLDKMAFAENIYNTIKSYEAVPPTKVVEWIQSNPDAWNLIVRLTGW